MLSALKAQIDGGRMMATLGELARWIKLSGSPEERESLDFVRAQMAALGFDTEIILHDAFISLPGAASLRIGARDVTCITHSMSPATGAQPVVGDVIDLGTGSDADFAAQNVAGKLLLITGIATPGVAERASRACALGVIQTSPHRHIHEMCISPVWGNPSLETVANLPRCPFVSVSQADGDAIRADLARGPLTATMTTAVDTGWRKTPILVAQMDVAEDNEPFVLFSGHHDTWHYGVMDNGSANATMIEVARVCAQERHLWRRGLRICFWSGHSHGRYSGSAWYADEHWHELNRRCVAHVNIDSPGGVGAGNLANTGVMTELRPLAAGAIMAEAGQALAGKRKARSADESFQGIGIPSLFGSLSGQTALEPGMRNALGWWWHTPDDLLDKIDEANLCRDARVVLEVLWRLLSDEVLPLDEAGKAAELHTQLATLTTELNYRFSLQDLTAQAQHLVQSLLTLQDPQHALPPGQINAALMAVSRVLVPLDYTYGNRFAHDPATQVPAWPLLAPLRRLAAADHQGQDHRWHLARVSAVRARNQLAYQLAQAQAAVDDALNG
ncbi:Peptidase M28 [Sodalis praecaptivus]|uniref:Peptidase M28 n=1 Tax=Sodalis praecaptivus TaxID=1239307 RepID=W0HTB9_9GAMM|nr:Peptidase M28 [Sodalis praecaptivus]